VRVSALAANREIPAVARAAIAVEIDQPLDGQLDVTTKIALDAIVRFDRVAVVALLVGRDAGRLQHDVRRVAAEAVDVRECDLDALVAREVDACDASHGCVPLTLTLLVLAVDTNDANHALALDGLALDADRFDGGSYFHGSFTTGEGGLDYGEPGFELGRVRTQGPCSVTAIVCSKCADI